MSYHELTGGYPWLTKRVARVLHPEAALPSRNGFAYVLALFSPYVGRGGGALGIVVLAGGDRRRSPRSASRRTATTRRAAA